MCSPAPDYVRHGITTLFAALEIATGTVTAAGKPHHRRQEFLALLKQVARLPRPPAAPGDGQLRRPQTPQVRDRLAANPRAVVHFTPTHASWMNLVEVWFSIIEHQAIHRGTFGCVEQLNAKIRRFIDGWNDRCHPFAWTKTAHDVLKKTNRQTTSDTRH